MAFQKVQACPTAEHAPLWMLALCRHIQLQVNMSQREIHVCKPGESHILAWVKAELMQSPVSC